MSDVYASKSRAATTEIDKTLSKRGSLFWFEGGVNCRNVLIENVYRNERHAETVTPTLRISKNATVDNLQLKNVNEQFAGDGATIETEAPGLS